MFTFPNPLLEQFVFLYFHENDCAFFERSRKANFKFDFEYLQIFEEMCRCWKCRYLHHYNTKGSSDSQTKSQNSSETRAMQFIIQTGIQHLSLLNSLLYIYIYIIFLFISLFFRAFLAKSLIYMCQVQICNQGNSTNINLC